jgi:hypothetical protein
MWAPVVTTSIRSLVSASFPARPVAQARGGSITGQMHIAPDIALESLMMDTLESTESGTTLSFRRQQEAGLKPQVATTWLHRLNAGMTLDQLRQCRGLVSKREKFGPLSSLLLRKSHGIGPDKTSGGLEPRTRIILVGPADGLPIWNF